MSLILSVGPSGGFYRSFTGTAGRISLGHVAITLVFYDPDAVLGAARSDQAVRRGATPQSHAVRADA